MPILLAGTVSALAASVAWRTGSLTARATLGAALVGTAVLAGTGWPGAAILAAFFVSSSIVSRLPRPAAGAPVSAGATPPSRNLRQVVANGGVAALGGVIALTDGGLGLWLVTASLAGAAADTWATEIGKAYGGAPRDLITGAPVTPGTSGGITPIGTASGAAGAALVAAAGGLAAGSAALALGSLALGFAAMMIDSLVGFRWQVRYLCVGCNAVCERPRHSCGAPTEYLKGVRWLDNDAVNAVATRSEERRVGKECRSRWSPYH